MKKKSIPFSILLVLAALPASAADLPSASAPPAFPAVSVYNWTGFYAGALGSALSDGSNVNIIAGGPAGPNSTPAQNAIARSFGEQSVSWAFGGQLGYNRQLENKWVFGVETDFAGTGYSNSQSTTNLTPVIGRSQKDITTAISQRLDWFGTTRGRFGYAGFNNALFYATGGVAYGGSHAGLGVSSVSGFGGNANPFNVTSSDSAVRVGWTVGAGIEAALLPLGPNWSVKGEYLYYDLGHDNVSISRPVAPPPGFTASANPDFRGSVFRFGLNYKFTDAPVVARY